MNKINYLYKFILKKNNYIINKYNFLDYDEKNNYFFLKFLEKILLKNQTNLIDKYYILKSYGKVVESIDKCFTNYRTSSLIFLKIITIIDLCKLILKSLKKSCKTEINFSKNKLSNDIYLFALNFLSTHLMKVNQKKALFLIQ